MPRFIHAIGLLGILLAPAGVRAGDETALYQRVSAGCFGIIVDGRLGGSGWFSAEPGWGFTAAHVVKDSRTKLQARTAGRTWQATLHAVDMEHDIALLRIAGQTPPGLPMAKAFPPVGHEVRLHGAPVFRHRVWLPGRVAGPGPTYEFLGGDNMAIRCFHVAGFAPKGTSGGPWVNTNGEVVGLQSGSMVSNNAPLGITFVTPVDALTGILKSRRHARTPTLGAAAEELVEQPTEWLAKLPADQAGIVLKVVKPDGPLGKAGAENTEIVLSINGQSLATRDDYYRTLHQLDPGRPAKIRLRNSRGETTTLHVKPAIQEDRFRTPPKQRPGPESQPSIDEP